MPIVTTSPHKRGKSKVGSRKSTVIAVAALVIAAAAAWFLLRPSAPVVPVPPPGEGPASSGPRDGVTPQAAATAGEPPAPRQPTTEAQDASTFQPFNPSTLQPPHPPATNAPLLPPRKTQRPTGFSGGPAEQLVAMMAGASDRRGMPPMPMSSEKALLKDLMVALTNDIVVYEDDTPETVAFKERVADFKNQFAKIVQDGGSITNAMKEYENWVNENKALRDAVIHEYMRLRKEASQEEADAYLAEANKELEAEGIETVNLGKERRRNRRAAEPSQEQ